MGLLFKMAGFGCFLWCFKGRLLAGKRKKWAGKHPKSLLAGDGLKFIL
jgi:hypothetical protein